jgi:hypothetical protein
MYLESIRWLDTISIVINTNYVPVVHYKAVYNIHILHIDYIYILAYIEQLLIDLATVHFLFHYSFSEYDFNYFK